MRILIPATEIEEDINAVYFLAKKSGLSKTKIKTAMQKGAVWIHTENRQKRLRKASRILKTGESISLNYDETVLLIDPPKPQLIYLAKTYSVWNKPAGLFSGGTRFGDHCSINRLIEKKLNKPAFLVHRLDHYAWGIMILAHSKKSARILSGQFENREISKHYQAIVNGQVMQACDIRSPIDGKEAFTSLQPLMNDGERSLVAVQIKTGRKHQIRKHLSEIGFPIEGDRLYGSSHENSLQLASTSVTLNDPETNKSVSFYLPKKLSPRL